MKAIFSAAAMLIALVFGGCASRPPLTTVPEVDLDRYQGKWFEIAKYPNWFQRGCASDTTAEYSALPDGKIRLVNSCRRKDGTVQRAEAKAVVVPGSGNARLRVNFGGPIWGDYWIIGLDEKNYSWALVGHPSRKFLWILAREPQLSDATYAKITALAAGKGYDPARIVLSPQRK